MRTRMILSVVLVMVLLASAVPQAVTPAAAVYEEKIPGDADGDNELTKDELVNAILPYMLDEGTLKLDDVGDAAYVYAKWNGKPRTVVDHAERTLKFYRPVERVVSVQLPSDRIILPLDRFDRLVGAEGGSRNVPSPSVCVGEMQFAYGGKISEVEKVRSSNVELIASLRPDVLFSSSRNADVLQDQAGAPVVVALPSRTVDMTMMEWWSMQIECIGEVLEREEEAEDLISFLEEKLALVTDISSQIDDSEKPRVYYAARAGSHGYEITKTTGYYDPIDIAGGINVAKEATTASEFVVSKEQIIKWNPDIILLKCHKSNPPSSKQYTIEMALLDPELQAGNVNAVKNGTVYYCMSTCRHYPIQRYIPEAMYFAKIFHPEKFKDLDLEKEGNEIMKKILGEEGLYTWLADDHGYIRDLIENPPEEGEW